MEFLDEYVCDEPIICTFCKGTGVRNFKRGIRICFPCEGIGIKNIEIEV